MKAASLRLTFFFAAVGGERKLTEDVCSMERLGCTLAAGSRILFDDLLLSEHGRPIGE